MDEEIKALTRSVVDWYTNDDTPDLGNESRARRDMEVVATRMARKFRLGHM